MASKQLPALPTQPSANHPYRASMAPSLPPVELSPPFPQTAPHGFSASENDVSLVRPPGAPAGQHAPTSRAVPYLGKSFYLAPRAHFGSERADEVIRPEPARPNVRSTWAGGRPAHGAPAPFLVGQGAPVRAQVAPPTTQPLTTGGVPTSPKMRVPVPPVPAAPVAPAAAPASSPAPPATARAPVAVRAAAPVAAATADPCDVDHAAVEPPISAVAATGLVQPCVMIEHRATWLQTELFLTFSQKDAMDGSSSRASGGGYLASTMLIPRAAPETAGRFRVWLAMHPHGAAKGEVSALHLLWDRKERGGFPELPELKRLVRDKIAPEQSLGHSEK